VKIGHPSILEPKGGRGQIALGGKEDHRERSFVLKRPEKPANCREILPGTEYGIPMKNIDLSVHFSIAAEKLYKAWLDPVHHAAMSYGGEAEFDPRVGGVYTTGDGYITGKFLEIVPGQRLVQTWRTTDFEAGQADSRLELTFADTDDGCTLRLLHTDLPDDQIENYQSGWLEYYIEPMKLYFGG
jgi:uncharacterized protein YndB with AHSA1/START domain